MRQPAQRVFLWVLAWVLILVVAAALRLPELDSRPMHADEAILGDKLGNLLETGSWKYDPAEFHGPLLLYASVPLAWLAGVHRYVDLTETHLRILPAVLGILLVLVPLALPNALTRPQAASAAALAAVSPAMTYYSRYYIPEILLALLTACTLVCGYRYSRTERPLWAILAGLSLGLALATKETALLAAFSVLAGAALSTRWRTWNWRHWLAAAAVASAILTLTVGIPGTLEAWRNYSHRAAFGRSHVQNWHYYLGMLLFWRSAGGPPWSEASLLALAAVGSTAAFRAGGFLRFIAVYTLVLTAAYSLIPYKTPWCLVQFLYPMILLAGVGLVRIVTMATGPIRIVSILAIGACGVHLLYQAVQASYKCSADPRNPYAYAHTTRDVYAIRQRIGDLAGANPEGGNLPIQVISSKNLWPLPWYLRAFPRIEWRTRVTPEMRPAALILATPEMEPDLVRVLYEKPPPGQRELYMNLFQHPVEIRPGVELRGYVRKSALDLLSCNQNRGGRLRP